MYVRTINALVQSGIEVHCLAHVTGEGLLNLPRVNPDVQYRIDAPLAPQDVYSWIQEAGGVETEGMYRTFNMGMGMAVIVPPAQQEATVRLLTEASREAAPLLVPENRGEAPRVVGEITEGRGVHLKPQDLHFPAEA